MKKAKCGDAGKIFLLAYFMVMTVVLLSTAAVYAKGQEMGVLRSGNNGEADKYVSSTDAGRGNLDNADIHRSTVANFVQSLLSVATRTSRGIGDQVRLVAQEQNDSASSTADAIKAVEDRSALKTFLIGTDYKNIGMIRSEMVKTQARIEQLTRLQEKMSVSASSTTAEQIKNFTLEQARLNNFLKQNESKFSLFGWFVKLFNK